MGSCPCLGNDRVSTHGTMYDEGVDRTRGSGNGGADELSDRVVKTQSSLQSQKSSTEIGHGWIEGDESETWEDKVKTSDPDGGGGLVLERTTLCWKGGVIW